MATREQLKLYHALFSEAVAARDALRHIELRIDQQESWYWFSGDAVVIMALLDADIRSRHTMSQWKHHHKTWFQFGRSAG